MRVAAILLYLLSLFSLAGSQEPDILTLIEGEEWQRNLPVLRERKREAMPALIDALRAESPALRRRAAHALREVEFEGLTHPDLEPEWLEELRGRAAEVLHIAARGTDEEASQEAIRSLAFLLRNRRWGHHGEPGDNPKQLEPLVSLGPRAVPVLIDLLPPSAGPAREMVGVRLRLGK
jgi:hypothetical protein